jgi:PHYB activation tagged suppressor 1
MARKGKVPYGNDLLGLMLLAFDQNKEKDTKMNKHESLQALVDECKTFFAAGSETVASLLTWTLLLLAEYSEWQDSARIEILELCGGNINNLDASMISKMKIVSFFKFLFLESYIYISIYKLGCQYNILFKMVENLCKIMGRCIGFE